MIADRTNRTINGEPIDLWLWECNSDKRVGGLLGIKLKSTGLPLRSQNIWVDNDTTPLIQAVNCGDLNTVKALL